MLIFQRTFKLRLVVHTLICSLPAYLAVLLYVFHLPWLALCSVSLGIILLAVSSIMLVRELSSNLQSSALALRAPNQPIVDTLAPEFSALVQDVRIFHRAQLTELNQQNQGLQQYAAVVEHFDAAVLVVDASGKISFINAMCREFLTAHLQELGEHFTQPQATALTGEFLSELLNQADLLQNLPAEPSDKILKIKSTTFNLHFIPQPLGDWIIVWNDISARLATEEQLQRLIGKAITGDFNGRIEVNTLQGFMLGLCKGFNMLMDAIQEPLQETVKIQQFLAEGDLTHKLDGFYLGEFATVKTAINTSINKLLDVVKNVDQVAENIRSSLAEINQHNADIDDRSCKQNDALTQAAASLEQMTASVQQNAQHTQKTNALATKAHQQAEFGNTISVQLMSAMRDINDASHKVVDISNVIDEIAFQTKLLALNAAVEAARAGEHGRGFKVVATEVQNLAKRSAEAAKEIKTLVLDNMNKIKTGSEFVLQTDQALTSILQDSELVNQLVSEIAYAIEEEYTGINQINQVVLNIQSSAEDNCRAVNSVMQISAQARSQAESLNALMRFFEIGHSEAHAEHALLHSSPTDAVNEVHEAPPEDDFFI